MLQSTWNPFKGSWKGRWFRESRWKARQWGACRQPRYNDGGGRHATRSCHRKCRHNFGDIELATQANSYLSVGCLSFLLLIFKPLCFLFLLSPDYIYFSCSFLCFTSWHVDEWRCLIGWFPRFPIFECCGWYSSFLSSYKLEVRS